MTRIVQDYHLIQSLRDSDFDRYSAYGEIFDNSIQANAKNIKTNISYKSKSTANKNYEIIESIAFGDDGDGMNLETIEKCLVLGYSNRYGDRKGIGRFGVGFTLGSLHQCTNINVYSKTKSSSWLKVSFEVADDPENQKEISAPIKENPPEDIINLAGKDSGTIILWKNLDKPQGETASEIIEETKIWIGRTFRKFIHQGVKFLVNNENVTSIDPLYHDLETTAFPEDPKSYLYKKIIISDWPVDEKIKGEFTKKDREITIQISLLPEQFRKKRGDGGNKESIKRCFDRNEGISILRNNREVFYGIPPFWPKGGVRMSEDRTPENRWWGCEVSFNAIHDRSFQVKNIKRGAVPTLELKKLINNLIAPTVHEAISECQKVWAKTAALEEKEKTQSGILTGHEEAEEVVKNTPSTGMNITSDKPEEEILKDRERMIGEVIKQNQVAWETKFASQPFTIVPAEWQGNHFVETAYDKNGAILKYNYRHLFHQTLSQIKNDIENVSGDDKETVLELAKELNTMIDLLLISYTRAEGQFHNDSFSNVTPEDVVEDLRMNWGTYLDRYLKKWKQNKNN